MQCPKCFRENVANSSYCAFCGFEFVSQKPGTGRFLFKKQVQKSPRQEILQQAPPKTSRRFDPATVARREHESRISDAEIVREEKYQEASAGESSQLNAFKQRHKIEDLFRPYEGKIKIADEARGSVILIMGNRTSFTRRTRITGIGNHFYEEFRIRPFQRKRIVLSPGTYNTISYIENWGVQWLRKVARNETHAYTRNPMDSKHNAVSRVITLDSGAYSYYLVNRNPLFNIGIPRYRKL